MRIEYFQLLDRVRSVSQTEPQLVAEARVPDSSTIFEGHFPGQPIMPGVLLIESMAQASGYLLLHRNNFEKMPFLVGVKDAKLRRFVSPGDDLVITASLSHDGSGYSATKTSIHCGSELVSSATLLLRLLPFPAPELLDYILVAARQLGLQTPAAP